MPSSRKVQEGRREAIREIMGELKVRNQQELLEELLKRGIKATQSSVSRDLKEMGAMRINGLYDIPRHPHVAESDFQRVAGFVRRATTVGSNMTILKTDLDAGPLVARAITAGNWPEVAGTVAGPDSVLVITHDDWDEQERLCERLERLLGLE